MKTLYLLALLAASSVTQKSPSKPVAAPTPDEFAITETISAPSAVAPLVAAPAVVAATTTADAAVDVLVVTETVPAPTVKPTIPANPSEPLPLDVSHVVAVGGDCKAGDCPGGVCTLPGACGKGACGEGGSCGSGARGGPVRRAAGGLREAAPVRRLFRGVRRGGGRLFGRGGCASCG